MTSCILKCRPEKNYVLGGSMFVEIKNGKKMSYKSIGTGETIIFIHSYLWDKDMWKPQMDELSKKYRCIFVDLWAHGESDELEDIKEYSLEELTEDVIEFANKLELKTFNYIGLSVGGMIGGHLLKKYPERIKKCVIMDSYLGEEPSETKELYFNMLGTIEQLKFIPEQLIEKISPMFFSMEKTDLNKELNIEFKETLRNIPKENIQTIVALGRGIFGRKNILSTLKNTTSDLYFVVGEGDIPRPVSEALEMSNLANKKLFIIKEAGHISNIENPVDATKILLEILEEKN